MNDKKTSKIRKQILLAIRIFVQLKSYALINLLGLSFGLTVGILTLLYVTDELSFDQFHINKDNLYKVTTANADGSRMETNAWPVARKLEDENPEIIASTYSLVAPSNMLLKHENNRYAHNIHFADQNFLTMFSFGFIELLRRNIQPPGQLLPSLLPMTGKMTISGRPSNIQLTIRRTLTTSKSI